MCVEGILEAAHHPHAGEICVCGGPETGVIQR